MKPELEHLIARGAKLGRSAADAMTTVGELLREFCEAVDELRNGHGSGPEKTPTRKRGKAAPRETVPFSELDSEKATRALRSAGVNLR